MGGRGTASPLRRKISPFGRNDKLDGRNDKLCGRAVIPNAVRNLILTNCDFMYININSKFYKKEKAKLSVLDRGFLYGDGVFETMRVYNGHIFALNEHLERLKNSA
ncbi:MAG: aminotransferase class IV, partial [bacterium]